MEELILLPNPMKINDVSSNQNKGKDNHRTLPLLFKWHETLYLGAAHGMVGILFTLLCFYPYLNVQGDGNDPDLIKTWIRETIDCLDDFCFPSYNLNSNIDPNWNTQVTPQGNRNPLSPSHDRLVHWCHGATGHILLLVKAFEIFHEDKYLVKAQNIATRVLIPRGLLKKGVGLCHGISGNAYALLAIHRATIKLRKKSCLDQAQDDSNLHSSEWLAMAINFAVFALEKLDELKDVPDRPYSLFEGMAGLSSLLIDLCEPDVAEFPLFGSVLE
jgi:lantibiotic modifying enzyme